MPFPIGGPISPLAKPIILPPRFTDDGIRINRVRLYAGSQVAYLRPERGISVNFRSCWCYACGVSWMKITDLRRRDLLTCAVEGYSGMQCWNCGDDTFLPDAEHQETYDQQWSTYDQ